MNKTTLTMRFLSKMKQNDQAASVFLHNGTNIHGMVTDLDEDGFVLSRDGKDQLISTNAFSTLQTKEVSDALAVRSKHSKVRNTVIKK